MQVQVYDTAGGVVEHIELLDDVFGLPLNEPLVHQVVVAQEANARVGTAASKTRGMVAGGGKKPWRQKGTGRARQGTTRAPHWRGGGSVFGPHPRSYRQAIPRKMRQAALRVALSSKAADENLIILSDLQMEAPSTKEMAAILQAIKVRASALIALPDGSVNVVKSARNIPRVETLPWAQLNVLDVLKHTYLIMPIDAVRRVEEWLSTARGESQGAEIESQVSR